MTISDTYLYRWWLYHGPGFQKYRHRTRIEKEILPPGFKIVRDGGVISDELDRLRDHTIILPTQHVIPNDVI